MWNHTDFSRISKSFAGGWSYLSRVSRPGQNLIFSLGGSPASDRETNESTQRNDSRGTSIHHRGIVYTRAHRST